MRVVRPHFDDRKQLRVVESGRRPGLADAVNGALFAVVSIWVPGLAALGLAWLALHGGLF